MRAGLPEVADEDVGRRLENKARRWKRLMGKRDLKPAAGSWSLIRLERYLRET